jgi:hypothetical protein
MTPPDTWRPREDAVCPYCVGDDPFTLTDVGMTYTFEGDFRTSDTITMKATRPAWELVLLEHIHDAHPERWEDIARHLRGVVVLDAIRQEMQAALDAAAGSFRRLTGQAPADLIPLMELDRFAATDEANRRSRDTARLADQLTQRYQRQTEAGL